MNTHQKPLSKEELLGEPLTTVKRLKRYLLTLLQNDELCSQHASQSYQHDNGFDKLVIGFDKSLGEKLRLHAWWSEHKAQPSVSNIHSHRWDFSSLILAGELRHEVFHEGSNGSEFYAYEYRSKAGGTRYELAPAGKEYLTSALETSFVTGQSYQIDAQALHRISVTRQEPTITLVSTSKTRLESTRVFSENKLTFSTRSLPSMNKEAYVNAIDKILKYLF